MYANIEFVTEREAWVMTFEQARDALDALHEHWHNDYDLRGWNAPYRMRVSWKILCRRLRQLGYDY